ncbi:MAG TPA: hypothetical protein VI142_06645 [Gaiellaceae bacterium]
MARALSTKGRFSVAYLVLGAAVGAALGAFIVIVQRPWPQPPPPWSAWKPATASIGETAQAIASHIGPAYRLSNGTQLARVILGPSRAAGSVEGVALADRPNAVTLYDPSRTIIYTLCGPEQNCGLQAAETRAGANQLRREALELALYTMKYANAADVVIFFPPLQGQTQTTNVLNFPREDYSRQLNRPLKVTLPHPRPISRGTIDPSEVGTIDALTTGHRYNFGVQKATGGRRVLVLQPAA